MIKKNSSTPFYNQLMNILVKEIEENLSPNDKMMSEREICLKYDVSRTTVRQAFSELENMGYIYKRAGKGTFVAEINPEKQNLMDYYSFTEQMRQQGKVPQTKVLNFEKIKSSGYISEQLNISDMEEVYKIERLRLADGIPMMIEYSYIPASLVPGLSAELLNAKPLYTLFSDVFDLKIKVAEEEFSASIISSEDAVLLDVAKESACFKLKRLTFDQENRVIEYTISSARSDQFNYRIKHYR